jgi:hypothetical protein
MIEHREKRTAPLREVRDLIHNKLKADLDQKKVQEYVEHIIKESGMEISGESKEAPPVSDTKKQLPANKDISNK